MYWLHAWMSDGSFEFNCESLISETAAFTASNLRMLAFIAVIEADEGMHECAVCSVRALASLRIMKA